MLLSERAVSPSRAPLPFARPCCRGQVGTGNDSDALTLEGTGRQGPSPQVRCVRQPHMAQRWEHHQAWCAATVPRLRSLRGHPRQGDVQAALPSALLSDCLSVVANQTEAVRGLRDHSIAAAPAENERCRACHPEANTKPDSEPLGQKLQGTTLPAIMAARKVRRSRNRTGARGATCHPSGISRPSPPGRRGAVYCARSASEPQTSFTS